MSIPHALAYFIMTGVCIAGGVIDARTQKVPNKLTYPAVLTGLFYWPIAALIDPSLGGLGPVLLALGISLVTCAIAFGVIHGLGGFGMGDVKLMLAVAALSAHWRVVFSTTVYALAAGFMIAVWFMVRRKVIKQTLMRILMAVVMPKLAKDQLNQPDSIRIPFAVCIAFGAAISGAENMLDFSLPWSWASR